MPPFILPVETYEDLENEPEVEWLVKPWLARRTITEMSGGQKTAGKSTLVRQMFRCLLDGTPFLYPPAVTTNILNLTEEFGTVKAALKRENLWGRKGLKLVRWARVADVPWHTLMDSAIDYALSNDIGLLVIDTLSRFSLQGGVSEADASAQLDIMAMLSIAAAEGLSVLSIRHDRKTGGGIGQSSRGSGAISGAVDIILKVKKGGGKGGTRRVIEGIGRYDECNCTLTLEFDPATRLYSLLDDPTAKDYSESFHSPTSILEFAHLHQLPRTSAQRIVEKLTDGGTLTHVSGSGKKGDPEKFLLTSLSKNT